MYIDRNDRGRIEKPLTAGIFGIRESSFLPQCPLATAHEQQRSLNQFIPRFICTRLMIELRV